MAGFLDRFTNDYNFYTIVSGLLAIIYLFAIIFVIFVPYNSLSLFVRDIASGVFLSMVIYGTVVMMSFGFFGLMYSSVTRKKGKVISIISLVLPWIFIALIYLRWPAGVFGNF